MGVENGMHGMRNQADFGCASGRHDEGHAGDDVIFFGVSIFMQKFSRSCSGKFAMTGATLTEEREDFCALEPEQDRGHWVFMCYSVTGKRWPGRRRTWLPTAAQWRLT
eukprot:1384708-Rhodomonas_salina.1